MNDPWDLNLGRLRIANPDQSSPDTPLQPQSSATALPSLPAVSPLPSTDADNYLENNSRTQDHSVSPVTDQQRQPDSYNTPSQNVSPRPQTYQQRSTDRYSQKSNLPLTYQDQQQAQFPQYPAMMPQNIHDRSQASGRPGSMYYSNLPINNTGNGLTRQGSQRRSEQSGTSTPQRSVSRRMPPVGGYAEREFSQPSHSGSTSSLPQRRTSRNLANTSSKLGTPPMNSNFLSGTPTSTGPLSASPYAMEGGPLSSADEWQERGAAVGVQRDYDSNGQPVLKAIKKGVKDFSFGATLGEGSYSTVLAAQDRQTQKEYAIKVLDKKHIIKEKKVKYVNIEKETLNRLTDHPGVVRLYYTFQDERSLYFVLDLCSGGELLSVLKRLTTFDEECTRFYGAQILDTISYMHSKGVIHRDLKPENVLMDDNLHIKITDFGTAKMLDPRQDSTGRTFYDSNPGQAQDRASSFVGTAEYVSPELLTDKNACKASDLWAFGCIIYQLLAGRPPFKAANEYLTFQKIVALEYEFPQGFPEVARDLVERLLVLDPLQRLSLENVKSHEFFQGIRWGKTLWREKAPRLKAYVPPPRAPIKLNGSDRNEAYGAEGLGHSTQPTMLPPVNGSKPAKPRVITELPPPSQLDIEWSPVLTKNNERILKLGNLNVNMAQGPHSPGNDGGNKFSRFFGGNTTKKRQRLVMVTSSARIIIAAAGGEEKKSKSEISLLALGTEVLSSMDSKGTTHWTVSTRDKHYTFEEITSKSSDSNITLLSTKEWLEAVDRAKEIVKVQSQIRNEQREDSMTPGGLVHTDTFESQPDTGPSPTQNHRGILQKQNSNTGDNESMKGRKRFSKRQSKSGLTAVF